MPRALKRSLRLRGLLACLSVFLLSACGQETETPNESGARAPIAPNQFALIPCLSKSAGPAPCQLLAAGGKYYLLGAPEGALDNLLESEIALLDGVLLFSLLPDHIDGLDTVRSRTWQIGREAPLLVAGPEGTEVFAKGIDSAYEVPDAELFAIDPPKGGYDASLMKPRDVEDRPNAGVRVVDTGDLVIRGFYAPSGQVIYQVSYTEIVIAIGMCGGADDEAMLNDISASGLVSSCNTGGKTRYFVE